MKKLCQPLLLGVCLLVGACGSTPSEEEEVVASSPTNPEVTQRALMQQESEVFPGDPLYRPPRIQSVRSVEVPTGSLFSADQATSLYQLNNKYDVGDMIVVSLDEQTASQKTLDYARQKNSDLELGPLNVTAGPLQIDENDFSIEHEQDSQFSSSADASQSNSLSGTITVYVNEVMPNGNLIVSGEKWLTLNTGKEYIRLTGEIRRQDIDASNTISSAKVGNALIEYSGKGDLQDNQERSLLDKLFTIIN